MPTSDRSERGYAYVLLLFVLAISAGALASLAEHVAVDRQREREAELLFRGDAIARAIERFRARQVDGQVRGPQTLEELVIDRRTREPAFHLRRLYTDPFTGRADWQLLRDAEGAIVGVHSRSAQAGLARVQVPLVAPEPAASGMLRVARWHFMARPPEDAAEPTEAPASSPS